MLIKVMLKFGAFYKFHIGCKNWKRTIFCGQLSRNSKKCRKLKEDAWSILLGKTLYRNEFSAKLLDQKISKRNMGIGQVIHQVRRWVSVLELMICVRNYRPSVICIGRRLTNSALAASDFSPMPALQHQ